MPSVQFHDSAYSHFLATDQENKLLMDKVGERVRNNQEIFTSLGDAILARENPLQSKFMSTREVLTIVLFIIFCIMMILFFVYQCLFFDQHLRNLKKKDLEQDNVSLEKVNETDDNIKKIVAEILTGFSKNSECTGSSFTMSEEGHCQHQASKTSETMKKGLALLKETAEVFMVFFFIFGGIQR